MDLDRRQILSDNKAKSGVYCFINKINGKKYVGSSVNLRTRFLKYFNINYLERNKNLPICLALLKYGHSNFSLGIVEYCEIPCVLYWETYSIGLLKPEYNILKTAGSSLGYKHQEEARKKISDSHKEFWNSNPMSEEERNKRMKAVRAARTILGKKHEEETKRRISAAQPMAKKIEVIDLETNQANTYNSIKAAAKALGIPQCSISRYFTKNQQSSYKGRYIFKKTNNW